MTKLSDLGPPIVGILDSDNHISEERHFYPCPYCGQPVDQRDLRQVFYHEGPGHEPLEPQESAKIIPFPMRPRQHGRP